MTTVTSTDPADGSSSQASVSSGEGSDSSTRLIAVSGASGLVGTELSRQLQTAGHRTIAITRSQPESYESGLQWSVEKGLLNPKRLESVDSVIHLAGESIAAGRWNAALKAKIRSSRVQGTRSLVNSLASTERRPRTLVCASAIGYYGDQGARELTEDSAAGEGFLPDVCSEWEEEAMKAEELGMRVVRVRIGVVLSPKGGALQKMLLPFRLGVGGVIGSGKQYWSWIGLHDLARVIAFCEDTESLSGAVNAVSPNPLTNYDFTKEVGRVLNRPTILPMPAFAAKLALGEMAEALLLSSARVLPAKLQNAGFRFDYPELSDCLDYELSQK